LLAFAGLCWPLLAFAGLCWPLLAFAGLCWPFLKKSGGRLGTFFKLSLIIDGATKKVAQFNMLLKSIYN
jgi:hypothetical protein